MLFSGYHHETLSFHILNQPNLPLILGFPWLRHHNSQINWEMGTILELGSTCHLPYLHQTSSPKLPGTTASNPIDLANILPEYHDYRQVFSKAKATSLPLQRPYDCAIDLLLGTTTPKTRLYSLSKLER